MPTAQRHLPAEWHEIDPENTLQFSSAWLYRLCINEKRICSCTKTHELQIRLMFRSG